jgi:UDP-N-acetylglucosamine 2-epimerase
VNAARTMRERRGGWQNPFGDGRSGERIVDILLSR